MPTFKQTLLELVDADIPSKMLSSKQRKNKPWLTEGIKTLINKRNRIFKHYGHHPNSEIFMRLEQLGVVIKSRIKLEKKGFLDSLGLKIKRNPKELWKLVSANSKDEVGIPPLTHGAATITIDINKASCFSDCFVSMFSSLTPSNVPDSPSSVSDLMHDIVIDSLGI